MLAFFLFFLFSPLKAWAYFDPGFGGYLVNSFISLVVTCLAFVSAAIIYFFRTIIGQRLISLWQKHGKLCLIVFLSALGVGSFFLGGSLRHAFFESSDDRSHFSNTRIIDPQRMFKGYSLHSGKLIDENGRIVKQWSHDYLGIIDENGDYYGSTDNGPSWGRYTWDDKVIWEKYFHIHHELYLSPKGTIFTFIQEAHDYNNYNVYWDVILEFDKNGKELQRFSFWDHREEFQPYHAKFGIDVALPSILRPLISIWQSLYPRSGDTFDYFHLNSFFMLPPNPLEDRDPAFRRGNWLISLLHGNMVFILDQDTKKILWHAITKEIEGGLEGQHSASMLPDGNILLFDNGQDRKASRVLVIDPLTLKIKWQYKNTDFFSPKKGFVQALPNGNFFITDSIKGHIFELTPDKKIVWDFNAGHGNIYRMSRYPKTMIDRLLQKGGP